MPESFDLQTITIVTTGITGSSVVFGSKDGQPSPATPEPIAVSALSAYVATQITPTSIGALAVANNLSDVANVSTARSNLGLGSAALLAASAILLVANNLSDLANAATARTNLGLGYFATGTDAANLTGTLASARLSGSYTGITGVGTLASGAVPTSLLTGALAAAQFPALTGDVTTTAGALATTLATVNSNVGSFGDATHVGQFTVNAKGLITAASNVAIAVAVSSLTGAGTGVLTALGVAVGSAGAFVTFNGALGTPSSGTLTNATGLPVGSGISGFGTGIAAALAINVGSAGAPVLFNGPGGTPSSMVGTNITGTAAGLTAGSVTTNANLTGPITSVGNATSIASQTGTGSKFVVDTGPTLITPVLGVATATSVAIGGATIGANALAVTGSVLFNTALGAASGGTGQSTYTKGDLLATPGGATMNKLGVGTNGFALIADSTSTNGFKWAAVTAGAAGSNTQVQVNASAALAGYAGLTYDNSTGTLQLGNTNGSLFKIDVTDTVGHFVVDYSLVNPNAGSSRTGFQIYIPAGGQTQLRQYQGNSGGGFVIRDFNAQEMMSFGVQSGGFGGYWSVQGTGNTSLGDFGPGSDNTSNIGASSQAVKKVFSYTHGHKAVAIASLPGSPLIGDVASVNDALSPIMGTTVGAGGSAKALVWYNNANWTVIGV